MYLKRLDIQGFKTFAQRATFAFPPGITAIVGPNGSGKSNFVDAVRWVLGEQSFANLRCKKTEDLIYGGGKGRAPMGFAEGFLTIDNSDRLLPLPYDEVTIGRRAYRNGENEYFINRARVRLRDLLDVVAPLGSSYTLINQGLVDAALALHPEDRQKLFEDAAEIGPYQAKKTEAERRLRECEANLVRLSDVVQEQEPQLRALKRQARDAEAVGAVETELNHLLRQYYHAEMRSAAAAVHAARSIEQARAAQLEAARQQRAGAANALQAEREVVRTRRADLAGLREAEADLDRQLARVLRERAVADERLAGVRRRHDELLEREQLLREEQAAAVADQDALVDAVARGGAALAEQRRALDERTRAAAGVTEARGAAEAELAGARREIARQTAAVGATEARHEQLERQVGRLDSDNAAVAQEIAPAAAAVQTVREQLSAAEAAVKAADSAWREREGELDAAQHALRVARDDRERAMELLAQARRRLADLRARYDSLARLVRSFEGTFPGVKAAMQWAQREEQRDFRLVSSIIDVPPELETAVEVVLGSRLQQIVVDRWEVAEAAIAELKRARAGRATFLPLDTLRVGRRNGRPLPDGDGILGCAADMVDYEGRYAPVAELLLGRTLIARDLAAARAALRNLEGGWGIVTLAGEQLLSSGALTGGSASKEAGTLRREREYRELPRRIDEAQAELAGLERSAAEHEAAVEAGAARVRSAEQAVREARVERDRRLADLEGLRRDLHRAEDAHHALLKRVERLANERQSGAEALAAALSALESARRQLASATAAVEECERSFEERQRAARTEEVALQALRESVVRAEAEQRMRIEQYERRKRGVAQAIEEQASLGQRIVELAGELLSLEGEVEQLGEQQRKLGEEARQLAERLRPIEVELREAEAKQQRLEAAERAATSEVLAGERLHADAAIELQARISDERVLHERAAADGLDPHELAETGDGDTPHDDVAKLPARIEQVRGRLKRMGPVNALAPAEYAALQERHTFLQTQLADVRAATATLRDAIRELDELMDSRFHATFQSVAQEFSQAFTRLFGGGAARLSLVGTDETDEAAAGRRGVEIVAQPPGKRQMHLQLLSGGERALTAAALLFAILKHQPRPFCIMDEVDAALDEANVVRFREALLELARDTQFIVVTHNRGTVEVADTLYGVSMGADGGSRVLSLRLVEGREEIAELEHTVNDNG